MRCDERRASFQEKFKLVTKRYAFHARVKGEPLRNHLPRAMRRRVARRWMKHEWRQRLAAQKSMPSIILPSDAPLIITPEQYRKETRTKTPNQSGIARLIRKIRGLG